MYILFFKEKQILLKAILIKSIKAKFNYRIKIHHSVYSPVFLYVCLHMPFYKVFNIFTEILSAEIR